MPAPKDKNTKAEPMTYKVERIPNIRYQLQAEAHAAALEEEEAPKATTSKKKEG